jgi:leader peptidase (prepilin peptidase) / N-methyltransferase
MGELLPELQLLLSPPVLALLGLCIGSFLNVVIHRVPLLMERQWWAEVAGHMLDGDAWRRVFAPKDAAARPPGEHQRAAEALGHSVEALPGLSVVRPRSRCPSCGHVLHWYENIPVLSWLLLKARCSACGVSISARYPLVELATGLLFAAIAWRFDAQPVALAWCAFAACLVALAMIDWDTTLLPDSLTLPLLWGGLVAAALGWTIALPSALWGAVAGYLSLWTVYHLFKLATGKEGMGHGDFKLLAALGAWLGWQMLVPIILAASVIGAGVGIGMKIGGRLREGRYVPFGPFLAGAGLSIMLIGAPTVLKWIGWA